MGTEKEDKIEIEQKGKAIEETETKAEDEAKADESEDEREAYVKVETKADIEEKEKDNVDNKIKEGSKEYIGDNDIGGEKLSLTEADSVVTQKATHDDKGVEEIGGIEDVEKSDEEKYERKDDIEIITSKDSFLNEIYTAEGKQEVCKESKDGRGVEENETTPEEKITTP